MLSCLLMEYKGLFLRFVNYSKSIGLDKLTELNRALFAPFKANAPKINGMLATIGDRLFGHNRSPVELLQIILIYEHFISKEQDIYSHIRT